MKSKPIEVVVYRCGAVEIDGVWMYREEIKEHLPNYKALQRPFVFRRHESCLPHVAARTTEIFVEKEEKK